MPAAELSFETKEEISGIQREVQNLTVREITEIYYPQNSGSFAAKQNFLVLIPVDQTAFSLIYPHTSSD